MGKHGAKQTIEVRLNKKMKVRFIDIGNMSSQK
jgi:hypothetical protein